MTVHHCRGCDLCFNANNQFKGEGCAKPDILLLFDHPNISQDEKGEMFAGNKMNYLKKVLDDYHLTEFCYFTHVLKCRPRKEDAHDYKKLELAVGHCAKQHLANEFNDIYDNVKILITFGKFAYQFLTSKPDLNVNVYNELLMKAHPVGKFIVLPLPHLSILYKDCMLEDLFKGIAEFYGKTYNPQVHVRNRTYTKTNLN